MLCWDSSRCSELGGLENMLEGRVITTAPAMKTERESSL